MIQWKGMPRQRVLWAVVALLVLCCVAVAAIAGTVYYRSADQADLTIDLIPENGYSMEQLILLDAAAVPAAAQSLADPRWMVLPQTMGAGYEIRDEYDVVWDTDTKVEIFKTSYQNAQGQITVAGENGAKVIAPGTENDYTFALLNNGRGWLDYKMTMSAFFEGLSDDKVIPVEVRVVSGSNWLLGDENNWTPVLELNTVEELSVVQPRMAAVYTLEWRWPFEYDVDGDGDISDGDALDTWLANQGEDITLTIQITTQSSYHDPDRPVVNRYMPSLLNRIDHFAYLYGYPDGTIRPNDNITRAEVAAIYFRLLQDKVREKYYTEDCDYSDVAEDAWYRVEVSTMTNLGILEGYPDGSFRPDQPVTRGELATILARLAEATEPEDKKTAFSDVDDHWAETDIHIIEEYGWIEGYEDKTFRPDAYITRAEAVAMTNRALNRMPGYVNDLDKGMHIWPDNADPEMWYFIDVQEASHSHDYERLRGNRSRWTEILEMPVSNELE